jgi:hypothetical protein
MTSKGAGSRPPRMRMRAIPQSSWMETLDDLLSPSNPPPPPAALAPDSALDDLLGWLHDSRSYEGHGWGSLESSIGDVKRTFASLPPAVGRVLEPLLPAMQDSIDRLKKGCRSSVRATAIDAISVVGAKSNDPDVLVAAWWDLVEACKEPDLPIRELYWRAHVFRSLARRAGHDVDVPLMPLRSILLDSAAAIRSVQAQLGVQTSPSRPEPSARWAGLGEDERTNLCADYLRLPARRQRSVVWLAFEYADLPSTHLSFGPLTFYDGRWIREVLEQGGPNLPAIPEELRSGDRTIRAKQLPQDDHVVLVRVDVGEKFASEALAEARANAQSVVALAGFHTGMNRWRMLRGHLQFVENAWEETAVFESDSGPWSRRPWSLDPTAYALDELRDLLAPHLPTGGRLLDRAVEALNWLMAAREQADTPQLFLNVRVVELVGSWMGGLSWQAYASQYLRPEWVQRRIVNQIHRGSMSVLDAIEGLDLEEEDRRRSEELRARVLSHESGGRFRFNIEPAVQGLSWLAALIGPETESGRRLRDLVASFSTSDSFAHWLEVLEADFDLLLSRLSRCRNAVAHGGPPLVQETAVSASTFQQVVGRVGIGHLAQGASKGT